MNDTRYIIACMLCTALLGFAVGVTFQRGRTMNKVEATVNESVRTGKPFIFDSGRMGLIEEVKHAKNGRTIAYRVISFTEEAQ